MLPFSTSLLIYLPISFRRRSPNHRQMTSQAWWPPLMLSAVELAHRVGPWSGQDWVVEQTLRRQSMLNDVALGDRRTVFSTRLNSRRTTNVPVVSLEHDATSQPCGTCGVSMCESACHDIVTSPSESTRGSRSAMSLTETAAAHHPVASWAAGAAASHSSRSRIRPL